MFYCFFVCLVIFCYVFCSQRNSHFSQSLWTAFVQGNTFTNQLVRESRGLLNLFWGSVFSGIVDIISQFTGFSGVCNLFLPLVFVCGTAGSLVLQQAIKLFGSLQPPDLQSMLVLALLQVKGD